MNNGNCQHLSETFFTFFYYYIKKLYNYIPSLPLYNNSVLMSIDKCKKVF
ncbi:hypothetical protein ESA2_CDS16 [Staphylococcus phage ESa2]|nr:hypothetical protein ESA2_CDS16 [Staphylococcus phage ESa2]